MRGQFGRFVPRVRNCSKLFQSWSWSQEKKGRPFPKAITKFKVQAFPKRIRSLVKPALKNSFSTNVQGTDHERAQFTLLGLLPRFGIIYSKLSGGDPGAKRRQKSPLYFTKATFSSSFLFLFLFLFLSLSLSLSLFLFLFLLLHLY